MASTLVGIAKAHFAFHHQTIQQKGCRNVFHGEGSGDIRVVEMMRKKLIHLIGTCGDVLICQKAMRLGCDLERKRHT